MPAWFIQKIKRLDMDKIFTSNPANKEKKFSDIVIPRILNYLKENSK